MFESVKNGIREYIQMTQEDIRQLQFTDSDSGTSTAQGRIHETDKQIKSAERYVKKLEFHLSKLDELHECYLVNQKLLEGARTMALAYSTAPRNRKDSLTNVKYGYEECAQTLCAIEAQLENMCGTFSCKLKGMAGFARLCPGDVFEVTIRHGPQKWKSKGRIEKNSTQRWDVPEFTFKSLVGEILLIKALECRSFKSVLLGQKNCEVKDLFSASPQLMTISINFNGSLKLSIIITWNPLDGMDETVTYFQPPARSQAPRRRPVSVLALNGHLQLPGVLAQNFTLWREEASTVDEALFSLTTVLEDFRGQYSELQILEETVAALESFIRRQSRGSQCSSRSSSISVSIESALEAFDFLNTEDSPDDIDPSPVLLTLFQHKSQDEFGPLLIQPRVDRQDGRLGIESLAQRLSEDTQLGSSLVLSELTEDKALREFWVTSVDHNLLFIHPERLLTTMEQKFAPRMLIASRCLL
nr:hypothetical protein BaRGS_016026 [Batillaria attramentaria]